MEIDPARLDALVGYFAIGNKAAFARMIGVSRSLITRILGGDREPGPKIVVACQSFLGVPPSYWSDTRSPEETFGPDYRIQLKKVGHEDAVFYKSADEDRVEALAGFSQMVGAATLKCLASRRLSTDEATIEAVAELARSFPDRQRLGAMPADSASFLVVNWWLEALLDALKLPRR